MKINVSSRNKVGKIAKDFIISSKALYCKKDVFRYLLPNCAVWKLAVQK